MEKEQTEIKGMGKKKLKMLPLALFIMFAAISMADKLWLQNEYVRQAAWACLCGCINADFFLSKGKAAKAITLVLSIACDAILIWDIYQIITA